MSGFEVIEWPAKFIGIVGGGLFHYVWLLGAFGVAIGAGSLVYTRVRVRYVRALAAGIIGLYVLLVISEAEKHLAAGIFRAMEARDEY